MLLNLLLNVSIVDDKSDNNIITKMINMLSYFKVLRTRSPRKVPTLRSMGVEKVLLMVKRRRRRRRRKSAEL